MLSVLPVVTSGGTAFKRLECAGTVFCVIILLNEKRYCILRHYKNQQTIVKSHNGSCNLVECSAARCCHQCHFSLPRSCYSAKTVMLKTCMYQLNTNFIFYSTDLQLP